MTKSMRNTLKSVAVMAIISAVAVALLALANAFFPAYKATLDAETADLIAGLVGLDVSGEEAISGGYIEMEETDEDTLAAFNDANGVDSSNKVLAAYRIAKGDAAGMHVVESQAQGYGGNPVIIVLTSFDSDNRIGSVAVKQQRENPVGPNNIFTDGYFEAFLEYVQGKTAVSSGEITSTTGATNTASINGLANAVNIAALYAAETYGGGLPEAVPEAVTDENLIAALQSVSAGTSFTSYPVSAEYHQQAVYGIYTSDTGEILVAGRGSGYGGVMGLIVTTDEAGAVDKIVIAEENEYLAGVPGPGKDFELTGENLTAILQGKTLAELEVLKNTDDDNVLTGTTGATLAGTRRAIQEAVIGALGFYPQAEEYIAGFGEV